MDNELGGPQPPKLTRSYVISSIERMREEMQQHLSQANALSGRIHGFEEILGLMPIPKGLPVDPSPIDMAEVVQRALERKPNGAMPGDYPAGTTGEAA